MKGVPLIRREFDTEFFRRELDSFLPDRIFDAHVHLSRQWRAADAGAPCSRADQRESMSLEDYRRYVTWLHGDRPTDALLLGGVPNSDCPASNQFVADEVGKDANCAGHFLVRPSDDPEWVRQEVRRLGMCGLKPFHSFLHEDISQTFQADVNEYLPEPLVNVANQEGWSITMHLVKDRGPADPANLHWLRHYAETYPNVQLMLCHTARAWNPAHALEAFPQLTGLDNVWICSDLNCAPTAMEAAFRILGPERFVYGSDFWWSHIHGIPVFAGDGFCWLTELVEPSYDFKSHMFGRGPTLAGLEHLRALKWACWGARLSDSQVESIFWNNARRLFGLAERWPQEIN